MRFMTVGSLIRLLCVLLLVPVALFACRRRLRSMSRSMSIDLDALLSKRTLEERERCEKLLDGIEGCKAIADRALSLPAQTENLHQALGEISILLAKALVK